MPIYTKYISGFTSDSTDTQLSNSETIAGRIVCMNIPEENHLDPDLSMFSKSREINGFDCPRTPGVTSIDLM